MIPDSLSINSSSSMLVCLSQDLSAHIWPDSKILTSRPHICFLSPNLGSPVPPKLEVSGCSGQKWAAPPFVLKRGASTPPAELAGHNCLHKSAQNSPIYWQKLPKADKNVTNSGHNKAVCTIYESCLSWFSCSGHFCAYAPSQKCKKCENMKTPLKSRKTFSRNNTNTGQSGHNYSMHNFDWFSRTGMWMEGILRRRLKSSEQDNKTGLINLTWL